MSERGRVLVLGLPYFGKILVERLVERGWRAEYLPHPGRNAAGWARVVVALARCDILYLMASRAERGSPQDWLMRVWRKPVVIHWVGTDVQIAADEAARGKLSARIVSRPAHWCDAPWLVDELAAIGIRSALVRLPIPISTGPIEPLPEKFRVLLYLPEVPYDREVFDVETILRLPAAVPEAHFTLVPSRPYSLPPLPPNLEAPGFVEDMDALYRETTVMVRQTTHDGMSFMAVESLSRGRYVVWSFPLEGAILASGFEAVVAELRRLQQRHVAGELQPNTEAATVTRAAFDTTAVMDELDTRLRSRLTKRK